MRFGVESGQMLNLFHFLLTFSIHFLHALFMFTIAGKEIMRFLLRNIEFAFLALHLRRRHPR